MKRSCKRCCPSITRFTRANVENQDSSPADKDAARDNYEFVLGIVQARKGGIQPFTPEQKQMLKEKFATLSTEDLKTVRDQHHDLYKGCVESKEASWSDKIVARNNYEFVQSIVQERNGRAPQ